MHRVGLSLAVVVFVIMNMGCPGNPRMAANSGKIHLAAQAGDRAGIDAAVASGGSIDQSDDHGMTPLSYAAGSNNPAIAEYLLSRGADPNHMSDDGETPLLIAARKGNASVAELLIRKGAKIDAYGEDGATALTAAVEKGNKELFELLLKNGAKPDVFLTNCDTALIKSVQQQDPAFFERLMAAGADPNLKGRAGNTPLIMAVYADKPEYAEKLLAAGARINDVNDYGYSALHFAAGVKGVNPAIAMHLVEKGADVNKIAKDALTPMKAACQIGQGDLVVYLYEKGANPGFEDASNEGLEINGTVHHILGDYFLAKDDLDKARSSYAKAQDYYKKVIDKCGEESSRLMWKQVGVIAGMSLVSGLQQFGASYQAQVQSRQMTQIAAMKYATNTRTGFQGYSAYMNKYHHPYVPTYTSVNMSYLQPAAAMPLSAQREYVKEKAKQFEQRSALLTKVLECFDKNRQGGESLHTCVDAVTKTTAAEVQKQVTSQKK